MNHYLQLVPISGKVHKKQSRMTRICIVLAVFLVTAIFGMADMEMKSQLIQTKQRDGYWHVAFREVTDKQAYLIKNWSHVKESSFYSVTNYDLDLDYTLSDKQVCICGMDESFGKIYQDGSVISGTFPKKVNEIAITKKTQEELSKETGSQITLKDPNGMEHTYVISGIVGNAAMLMESDVYGVFLNMDGYNQLLGLQKENAYQQRMLYVQFQEHCNISKVIEEMKEAIQIPDSAVSENVKLLGIMGQSSDSYMLQLYGVAAILAVLVITAGILMISSNLNSNIARRTEFFGMLRCLGATKKQIIRFVRLEALNWCKSAIPIGLGLGSIIIIILCAMLRFLSPSYFSCMPVFSISFIGIVFGIIVGILTVLMAAMAPAKRAAKVSPLMAVSGNYNVTVNTRKKLRIKGARIETKLGIYHAKGNKKNFILMVMSFAFSIVLFLAFTTIIDFMNHGLTPLRPYAPDLSFYYEDQSPSIDKKLVNEMEECHGVKRAYGRKFAYGILAYAGDTSITVNLITYEENQFGWAEKNLLEGEAEPVEKGEGLFSVYDPDSYIHNGENITFVQNDITYTYPVLGVLKDAPFDKDDGVENIIVREALFNELIGDTDYTIIDVQLTSKATDEDITAIRSFIDDSVVFSDRRIGNRDVKGGYYSFALFVYGFLTIIALISIFNIINSIDMSVAARLHQYGAMRAIGMGDKQILKMVTAEAATYGVFGILFGCVIGLPINKVLFESLVTFRWGDAWYVPIGAISVISFIVIGAIAFAVYNPYKQIKKISIVETINYS